MLLPHGYEGQGPEHSNAFLERFLQLCAQDNIQVCNLTEPAQYFHLLRRQMKREFLKPLILMTPKSLLRHKRAVPSVDSFTSGYFREVLDDPAGDEDAGTIMLCSGKVYYDLIDFKRPHGFSIIRIEQFYPYPEKQLQDVLNGYHEKKQIHWVQEEPKNRGGWTFMYERLTDQFGLPVTYRGRPFRASPATGSCLEHKKEQEDIVVSAFS